MKELSIEQKAKAYDKAIERANSLLSGNQLGNAWIYKLLPELKESEDEMIRKLLIEAVIQVLQDQYCSNRGVSKEKVVAWLEKQGEQTSDKIVEKARTEKQRVLLTETDGSANIDWDCRSLNDVKLLLEYGLDYIKKLEKQGEQEQVIDYPDSLPTDNWELIQEFVNKFGRIPKDEDELNVLVEYVLKRQKPTAWSEEDMNRINRLIAYFEDKESFTAEDDIVYANWLKSLRPQNWTKEDKERYISCLQRLSTGNPEQPETINSKWFKEHVYPQPTWKPSDEQMNTLEHYMHTLICTKYKEILFGLYTDLKKLRKE